MSRTNPASVKVIGLGLGRTGTDSLRGALEMLGFGPCYHMKTIIAGGGKDFPAWFEIGDGNRTPEMFDELFRGFGSVVDYPEAMYPAEMYAAYPNAKFILTIRDSAKWEKSMKETILYVAQALPMKPNKTEAEERMSHWLNKYMIEKHHGGRLENHAQQEFINHNERVKEIIPPEQLLVYDVGEGWERLVEFLGAYADGALPTSQRYSNISGDGKETRGGLMGLGGLAVNVSGRLVPPLFNLQFITKTLEYDSEGLSENHPFELKKILEVLTKIKYLGGDKVSAIAYWGGL